MENDLLHHKCVPCEGGMPPMIDADEDYYLKRVTGWELHRPSGERGAHFITKNFTFANFKETIAIVNKIAELAESEGHHPDMTISFNRLSIKLFTHAVKGLSLNDFVLAAKIDKLIG